MSLCPIKHIAPKLRSQRIAPDGRLKHTPFLKKNLCRLVLIIT